MKRHNFYLPERQIDFLQKVGKSKDLSASEVLRRVIDRFILEAQNREK